MKTAAYAIQCATELDRDEVLVVRDQAQKALASPCPNESALLLALERVDALLARAKADLATAQQALQTHRAATSKSVLKWHAMREQ